MSKDSLHKVLKLINQAKELKDGLVIYPELLTLQEQRPNDVKVLFCKDESALNSLLIIVFDVSSIFFVVSQDGTNSSFYLSPNRLDYLKEAISKFIASRGPICHYCASSLKLVKFQFKLNNGAELSDCERWECSNCKHSFMDQNQEEALLKKKNDN